MPVDFDTFYQAFVRPFIQSRHGVSSPDSDKARFNLENTPEQNRVYLGTYFPRTVLESLCVFTHLFESVPAVRDAFGNKRRIRVLDYGCGTGGELIGLLAALSIAFPERRPAVEIRMIDGNADTLRLAEEALEEFKAFSGLTAEVNAGFGKIKDADYFCSDEFVDGTFDVIVTSKFLNEMNECLERPYFLFMKNVLPKLADDGIAVMLETTCKQSARRGGAWANQQMFGEANAFLARTSGFRTLFPFVCSVCTKPVCKAYPQLMFDFSSLGYDGPRTKLACRAICREELWQKVRQSTRAAVYYLDCKGPGVDSQNCCVEPGAAGRLARMPRCCLNLHAKTIVRREA